MPATEQLQIRVTPAQKAAIRRGARRAKLSMSEWVLTRVFPSESTAFEALARRLARSTDGSTHVLAAIADLLARLTVEELRVATESVPLEGMSTFHATYLAAMVEQACHGAGVPVPDWARRTGALSEPYFASELSSLRLHLLRASPPPFRRRNLFVDATVGDRV